MISYLDEVVEQLKRKVELSRTEQHEQALEHAKDLEAAQQIKDKELKKQADDFDDQVDRLKKKEFYSCKEL